MRFFSVLILISLCSCALPAPEFEKQQFVPRKDIVANSLYQEGLTLYKSGRFIDSEMKFRQALYLFPEAENIRSSMALVMKSNGLYAEAEAIYRDLVEKYPEVNEYKYNLADTLYRKGDISAAFEYFNQALLGFEEDLDTVKAAAISRTMASVNFLRGREEDAFCFSQIAYSYTPDQIQMVRHIKILFALGFYNRAKSLIDIVVSAVPETKDPSLLKLAAMNYYALSDMEEAKNLMQRAIDHQTSLKVIEPELETIKNVFAFKFPDWQSETIGEEEIEEEEKPQFVFNEQVTLYWPHNLVSAYYEYMESQSTEEEEG